VDLVLAEILRHEVAETRIVVDQERDRSVGHGLYPTTLSFKAMCGVRKEV
jgi:hypothetical protein